MPSAVVFPPAPVTGGIFPNVFVFPPERIVDPQKNVLLVANLWNFAINHAEIQPDHFLWLGAVAAKRLIASETAGARMIGLASPTGSDDYNLQLGLRRAQSAEASLALFLIGNDLVHPPSTPQLAATPRITVGSQGDAFAENHGAQIGTEDARWRSVLITILADRTRPTNVRLL